MNRGRVILWGGGLGVVLLLATWFFMQPPEDVDAWLSQKSAPQPLPPPTPPLPQKRVGPCVGLTWTLLTQEKLVARVGPAGQLQAPCDAELSVLCFNGSEVAVTTPMSGLKLSQRVIADAACMSRLGAGWRMISVRDGAGGVTGRGELPKNVRFWIAGESLANPWD